MVTPALSLTSSTSAALDKVTRVQQGFTTAATRKFQGIRERTEVLEEPNPILQTGCITSVNNYSLWLQICLSS